MPTFLNDGHTATLFFFNHIITHFGVPQAIVTDHGSHFQNQMMSELHAKLGFLHENSSPYYPQENGQVEAINKVLKTMIQRMVGENKTSWHLQLFSALWAYRTFSENCYWIHSFPVSIWHRSCFTNRVQNSLVETQSRTPASHFC
jgi:transposase InsO family protein